MQGCPSADASGVTSMMSIKLPLWLRFFLLIGVIVFAAGAGLLVYRYYTRPVTLTVAVGSIDGEAAKAMLAIAGEFVSTNAPMRLKVIDSGTAIEAANAFSAGKVDLAVVRGDVGDLSQAQAVVVVSHMVVLIIAPPGSSIDRMDNLKGRTVGVVGGVANAKIVDALTKEYDLASAKVAFKYLALTDVRQAVQSKQVCSSRSRSPKNTSRSFVAFLSSTIKMSRCRSPPRPRRELQGRTVPLRVPTPRRAPWGARRRSRKTI